jgi:aryl-alcohol dehydrogenase-like predicted oxidoreductase
MTFGVEWGWGADQPTAQAMFDRYVAAGGNFIDTADGYTNGTSEELVGRFIAESRLRDAMVIATKFTFSGHRGNPNAGGNGRKNIYRAIEGSLRRLKTDYIDLYWMHAWDTVTPLEEVLSTMDALIREGKIRYFGLSDVPAWYATRAQTVAELKTFQPVVALQLEYSLIERNIEREHIPLAQELGMGLCPWSPLGNGFLSGKYAAADSNAVEGRLNSSWRSVFERVRTERNACVLEAVRAIATELGRTPAQIALSWVFGRPGITSTIIGATKMSQLEANLAAADFHLPQELSMRLDEVSRIQSVHPYSIFSGLQQAMIHGASVRKWMPQTDPAPVADT